MIKHIVLFRYKADATPAQKKAMEDGFEALPGLIPEIKSSKLVPSASGRPASNYHAALLTEFASVKDLDSYRANPHHLRVVAFVDAACETRVAFDYE
jgi:hypothetical protein